MFSRKLDFITSIPQKIIDDVNQPEYLVAGAWDRKDEPIKAFKEAMKKELLKNQNNRCAYCEKDLEYDTPEIEHIASKGGPKKGKYVKVQFWPDNLVYSCHFCNSPRCKGSKNVVVTEATDYRAWKFKIVHPYLDDPKDYYKIMKYNRDGLTGFMPQINSESSEEQREKAKFTLEMFKFNEEKRIQDLVIQWRRDKFQPKVKDDKMSQAVKDALKYKKF